MTKKKKVPNPTVIQKPHGETDLQLNDLRGQSSHQIKIVHL